MAKAAVARETLCALRRQIARIEGTLPETLDAPEEDTGPPPEAGGIVLRRAGVPGGLVLPTGVARLDAALGGGLPHAALTEIHAAGMRDAGAAAGFVLALATLARKGAAEAGPLMWIATGDAFAEAGPPHAPGLAFRFGLPAASLLVCAVRRPEEALWAAEEAAAVASLSAVVLEMRGRAARLDLTATRRLHRRAREAGRPLHLLRYAAPAEPTAAPVRLAVGPAPAGLRHTLAGPLEGSIGPPAFAVAVTRSRLEAHASFTLEWNADERAFRDRGQHAAQDPRALVPLPADRAAAAPAAGPGLARRGAA